VATGGEQGLLGIAFAPDGSRLYAHYSDEEGDGRLASWAVADGAADPGTEIQLMRVEQPYGNHNGGQIAFGPDGHLYWGLGDGGSAGDPEQRAQELGSLLGKILRIRPTPGGAEPFIVPTDNPFYGREGAQPAIWVYGLRNPWRFAFDRDGGLWIGDVGQGDIEEIDYLPAGEQAGANLGWDRLEGTRPFEGEAPPDAVPPVFEYSHDVGISVTGGVVYEGAAIPGLAGAYLFGDYGSGFVSALVQDGGRWVEQRLPVEVPSLAAFGVDASGEVYLLSLDGPIYRLVPAAA
jgi:glucose/arabinose dehydrogenase